MVEVRDLEYTDRDFQVLRKLVTARTGIVLCDEKRELVYGRLSKRLRALGLTSFEDYCDVLAAGDENELIHFVNAITTNLTSFFREAHHFDYLATTLLPELLKKANDTKRIRIWSAGCSTGEEPYSIAMVVRQTIPQLCGWDIKILATDIDSNVLVQADGGVYRDERVNGLSRRGLKRWFRRETRQHTGLVRIAPEVRELVTFRQLNLMQPWPMKGPFDVVFCRNVVIYFDKPAQRTLFDRFADLLAPDGHLFVGHSETLFRVCDRFELLANTIYRRRV